MGSRKIDPGSEPNITTVRRLWNSASSVKYNGLDVPDDLHSDQETSDQTSNGLPEYAILDMVGVQASLPCTWSFGGNEYVLRGRDRNFPCSNDSGLGPSGSKSVFSQGQYILDGSRIGKRWHHICSSKMDDDAKRNYSGDDANEDEPSDGETESVNNELIRENLERIIGADDSAFSGIDLATLIRKKYGRSYDVQLIKKEFMGKNLLAMNVMWKYMEQRSFPLTEEEYLLRLDDVANTLKCWGAVSHIRNSLEKLKERPRIGKDSAAGLQQKQFIGIGKRRSSLQPTKLNWQN
ncbi:hypothetical protein E3N88_19552 [Mikania micrantha]|uniref:Uncharacterized protein n=1 Tax=Mikania micrantha TaxID=192012 RepID=A0A5N6NNK3_9ASTR|nr:hypothetical protein E3N88_19552 [Mikania micrantha]